MVNTKQTKAIAYKARQAMALSGSAANPKETVAAFPQKIKEDNPQITFVDDYKDAAGNEYIYGFGLTY